MIVAMPKKKIESKEQTTKSLLHLDIVQKGPYAQIHQGKEVIYNFKSSCLKYKGYKLSVIWVQNRNLPRPKIYTLLYWFGLISLIHLSRKCNEIK